MSKVGQAIELLQSAPAPRLSNELKVAVLQWRASG